MATLKLMNIDVPIVASRCFSPLLEIQEIIYMYICISTLFSYSIILYLFHVDLYSWYKHKYFYFDGLLLSLGSNYVWCDLLILLASMHG